MVIPQEIALAKSDYVKVVRYLEDAARYYSRSTGARCRDRARLIKLLVNKITANNRLSKP